MNMYADSEHRYRNDTAFKYAVDALYAMAVEHGFTPGELKQIAFMAALKAEMLAKPMAFTVDERGYVASFSPNRTRSGR